MEPSSFPSDPGLDAVRQRRVSLRASMSSLERALASPAAGRIDPWNGGVSVAVQGVQKCMREHIAATEGPGGFHSEMVAAAPRLSHAVEVSVREHAAITGLVAEVMARSGHTQKPDDVDAIREVGTQLLGLLSRHRQRGADMIYEAYQSDLGGEN